MEKMRKDAYVYCSLCIELLKDTNSCVCNEDEEDDKGFYKCAKDAAAFLRFYDSKHEGDKGGCEEDEDKLIFELVE